MRRPFASTVVILALLGAGVSAHTAQQSSAAPPPGARALRAMFDYLAGQWEGEASGSPGEGTGRFTFEFALDGNVVTRRSHTDFPAAKDRPATSHEDLVVVYAEAGQVRADYFDNEAHVIHYAVSFASESATVIFVSPIAEGQPRFRLTYRPLSKDRVEVAFETAPPDKPTAFTTYVKGVSRRRVPSTP